MNKVKDTESFIQKASIKHNNKYTYENTVWVSSRDKLIVTCPIHGDFLQRANNHLTGYGCNECATLVKRQATTTVKKFIEKANSVHNNKYDYSDVKYINTKTKVGIICKDHGIFYMTPENHTHKTRPQGCPTCGALRRIEVRKDSKEDFVIKANKVHKEKYDYTDTNYINFHTKVEILCRKHGSFSQTPAHHIVSGNGCPRCANTGFNKDKPAMLYYLSINNGELYKIGITNRTVDERFTLQDLKSIEVIKYWEFESGEEAFNLESSIKSAFKDYKYRGNKILSSGNTELFTKGILDNSASIDDIQSTLDTLKVQSNN